MFPPTVSEVKVRVAVVELVRLIESSPYGPENPDMAVLPRLRVESNASAEAREAPSVNRQIDIAMQTVTVDIAFRSLVIGRASEDACITLETPLVAQDLPALRWPHQPPPKGTLSRGKLRATQRTNSRFWLYHD